MTSACLLCLYIAAILMPGPQTHVCDQFLFFPPPSSLSTFTQSNVAIFIRWLCVYSLVSYLYCFDCQKKSCATEGETNEKVFIDKSKFCSFLQVHTFLRLHRKYITILFGVVVERLVYKGVFTRYSIFFQCIPTYQPIYEWYLPTYT